MAKYKNQKSSSSLLTKPSSSSSLSSKIISYTIIFLRTSFDDFYGTDPMKDYGF